MFTPAEFETRVSECSELVQEVLSGESRGFTKEREKKLMQVWKKLDTVLNLLQSWKNY